MAGIDKNTIVMLNGKLEDCSLTPKPIINNGVTINNDGKFGNCYDIDVNKMLNFDVNLSNEFTIEWFEYRTSRLADQYIFSTNNSKTSSMDIFMVGYSGLDNSILFYYGNGSSWVANGTMGTTQANKWVHRCLTYKNNSLKFYENGNYKNQFTINGLSLSSLYLGGSWKALTSANNIKIDEFRVSDVCRYEGDFEIPANPFSIDSPNINIISQDRSKINFNLSMYEDFTINSVNVYVNGVIKKSFSSNYDNMTFNINEDDDYIKGSNIIKIVANFDEGKEIEYQLEHKIYVKQDTSLKGVMDEFEKISFKDFSSIDIITINELPNEVKEGQIVVITDVEHGNILFDYQDPTTFDIFENGDIFIKYYTESKKKLKTQGSFDINLDIFGVKQFKDGKLQKVPSYIGVNGKWEGMNTLKIFENGDNAEISGGYSYTSISSAGASGDISISNMISVTVSSYSSAFNFSLNTKKAIPVSSFNTLFVEYEYFSYGNKSKLMFELGSAKSTITKATSGKTTHSLDISKIASDSNLYIKINRSYEGTYTTGCYLKVYKIWVE